MDVRQRALKLHADAKGKIAVVSKVQVTNRDELAVAYTPGVAEPCREIHKNVEDVWRYTSRGNLVAIVSDGTAVLGLGNIGAEASLPVMEGKSVLFKAFAGVDAFPIVLGTKEIDEIVNTVTNISPGFGGINLEDIAAPQCFEIEEKLRQRLSIPVFHDDQHGTAIVVASGLINALKVVKKNLSDVTVVINGPGAAGLAIAKLLLRLGVADLRLVGLSGVLGRNNLGDNKYQAELAQLTNKQGIQGKLAEAMQGADIFIGVSRPGLVSSKMVASMNRDAIVFAMANPEPEIYPDAAKAGGAAVIGTGRSDFPNQVNNVLAFPGVFRGALDVRAKTINEEMKVAAAYALADLISPDELNSDYVIADPFDLRVAPAVAAAVAAAARKSGVAQI